MYIIENKEIDILKKDKYTKRIEIYINKEKIDRDIKIRLLDRDICSWRRDRNIHE